MLELLKFMKLMINIHLLLCFKKKEKEKYKNLKESKRKKNMTREQLSEMEKDGIYEYITQNYWKMEKEELRDVCKELSFALYHHDRELLKELEKEAINELKENADDE